MKWRLITCVTAILIIQSCSSCQQKTISQKAPAQTSNNNTYTVKPAHPDGTGKVYQGREIAHVMGSGGGAWLERTERQQEEDVAKAIDLMQLQPGMAVADIGAGTGYYSFRIANKVPEGKVYAVEIQTPFVQSLQEKKKETGTANVEVVQGSEQSPNLAAGSIDLAIMVDVYHELAYPKEMLDALYKALKPGGKVLLLEYRKEDPSIPIKELHKMSVAQATKEMAASGFVLERKEDALPIQHFLLYAKR